MKIKQRALNSRPGILARHLHPLHRQMAARDGCPTRGTIKGRGFLPLQCFLILLLLTGCAATSPTPTLTLIPTLAVDIPTTPLPTATPTLLTPQAMEAYPVPETPAIEPSQAYPAPETPPSELPPAYPYPAPGTPVEPLAPAVTFDAARAYRDLEYQLSLGPRTPGSEAHTKVIEWMRSELSQNGWTVEIQETTQDGQPVRNVIARRGSGAPWTILGAHFDSRMKADHDPDTARQEEPVPGANDGASGVAVLMELARVLPENLEGQVWLAFFDAEDQGKLPGWDWILGSRALAASLTTKPDAVIIIDMIGDADLNIAQERNSDPEFNRQIWDVAARLGYGDIFLPRPGFNMLDDHTPFLQKGIRAVDIIDFEYPYWHTTADTADKVSPQSLKIIGDTVGTWLVQFQK